MSILSSSYKVSKKIGRNSGVPFVVLPTWGASNQKDFVEVARVRREASAMPS